jgi:ribosomal protein S27E
MPHSVSGEPSYQGPLSQYPRITLRCGNCTNEFCVNVVRFQNREKVSCLVCGEEFPADLGTSFAESLASLFAVKHELEKRKSHFNLSFVYKSTFKQPPAPFPFHESDFPAMPSAPARE